MPLFQAKIFSNKIENFCVFQVLTCKSKNDFSDPYVVTMGKASALSNLGGNRKLTTVPICTGYAPLNTETDELTKKETG